MIIDTESEEGKALVALDDDRVVGGYCIKCHRPAGICACADFAKVIYLRDKSTLADRLEEYLSGSAKCIACQHKWEGVAPVGTTWLECPSCSLLRGRFINCVDRPNDTWHCDCGNELFVITRGGAYCPNCGVWQKW